MSGFSRVLLILGFVAGAIAVHGQAARSPFSSFGIGDYYGSALVHNQGMGGLGISNPQSWYLNNQNPALLVFNRLTVFEAGYLVEQKRIRNATTKEKNANGNLSYLQIAFPIKPGKWTSSFGVAPYSGVNYNFTYTQPIRNSQGTVNVTEQGSGGINQVTWANGVSITRNISVGVKVNYLFSSIERDFDNYLPETTDVTTLTIPSIKTRQNVSDFSFSGGLSLRKDSLTRKNHRINIGLVYDFRSDLRTKYFETVLQKIGTAPADTLVNNRIGQTTLPQTLSAGISFGRPEHWTIGADVTWLDYTQFKDFDGSTSGGTTGWRMVFGGEVTPDPYSLSSYLKRMTYRTGVSIDNYPYLVNGNTLKDVGVNLGFSMPVGRVSSLDIALKAGRRGDINTNTVAENYFKIYFGVTFNDQWFIKRRFD
jgi:hypothetical protein